MEYFGHLEGMLDRDIRTTKTRVYDSTESVWEKFSFPKNVTELFATGAKIVNHHCCHPSRTKSYFFCRKGYSSRYSSKNFLTVLTLGVYLIVLIPTTQSAPGYNRMDSAKWTNPCGTSEDETDFSGGSIGSFNDAEFLDPVISSTASALNKANEFKERFTQRTFFNKNFDRAVDEVTPDLTKYGWLVMLPNEYVNKTAEIPLDIFKDIKITQALQDAFHKAQIVAVALSHTVVNQERNRGRFLEEFNVTSYYLSAVLCELQSVMRECSVAFPPNVTVDIIPPELRVLDKTESAAFDFVVLRELIKTLNYISNMMEYIKKNMQSFK